MKILRVITRLNVGGPSIHVALLARRFSVPPWETVVVHGDPPPGEGSMADLLDGTGARVVRLAGLGRSIRPLADLGTLLRLLALLLRERPAIVHTHQAKAGALGRLAAWLARVPVRVHTYHGTVFRGHYGPAASRLWVLLERLLARITTRIVAVNDSVRRDLVEVFRVAPAEKVSVIPLGFDLEAIRASATPEAGAAWRRSIGIAADAPVVGIFGRFAPVKDHGLFLEAARRALAARPDARFVIAGGGETEGEIRAALAADPALAAATTLTGYVRPIGPALAGTDVVVLTSRSEGTPVAVVEAMAAGRAVVATAVGGVAEVVEDGRTGLLVARAGEDAAGRAATADALARAILRLLGDPAERSRLGAAARRAVDRFDARRLGDDLERLYDALIEGGGRRL